PEFGGGLLCGSTSGDGNVRSGKYEPASATCDRIQEIKVRKLYQKRAESPSDQFQSSLNPKILEALTVLHLNSYFFTNKIHHTLVSKLNEKGLNQIILIPVEKDAK